MKKIIAVALTVILAVSCCALVALSLPKANAEKTVIYTQNFENYNGTEAADSYAWNGIGWICDAPSKSVVSGEEAIDGWSFKTGGTGYLEASYLFCSRTDTVPFSSGNYTMEMDIRIVGTNKVNFEVLVAGIDTKLGGVEMNANGKAKGNYAKMTDCDGYWHVTFDVTTDGSSSWVKFGADFGNGGYIVVDNIVVSTSENTYPIEQPLYELDFENYNGTEQADSYAWNGIGWICDAPEKSVVSGADAIDGWSFKTGGTGRLDFNHLLCSRAGTLPFGIGNYTMEMDIRIVGTDAVTFEVLVNESNFKLGGVDMTSNGQATGNYATMENCGNYWHVAFDVTTDGSDTWTYFAGEFGNGGHIVVDNISIKESQNTYPIEQPQEPAQLLYLADFESYDGSQAADAYVWFNMGWACDAPAKSIVSGSESISGWSLKAGGSGHLEKNGLFKSNVNVIPFGAGNYTVELDIRLVGATQIQYGVYSTPADQLIGSVVINADGSVSGTYATLEDRGNYWHVAFDVTTDGSSSWVKFGADFGNGGYIVVDNIVVSTSENTYPIEQPLYELDFENYNGTEAADSYAWNGIGWICDSPEKSVVSGADAIDGWSFKTGGTGRLDFNHLFCSRAGTLPFGIGNYTMEMDIRIVGTSKVAYEVLVDGTNVKLGGVEMTADGQVIGDYATMEDRGGYWHVTFDVTTDGSTTWSHFIADFGSNGGYIVVDNFKINPSENSYPIVKDLYLQNFENYDGSQKPEDYAWHGIGWLCDAPDKAVVNDADAISGWSFKAGGTGLLTDNHLLATRSNTLPFGIGHYTMEMDIRIVGTSQVLFEVLVDGSNAKLGSVELNTNGTAKGHYATMEDRGGYWHVTFDVTTDGSTTWCRFTADFGTAGGYIVVDNVKFNHSENTYPIPVEYPIEIYRDTFDGYNGGDMPAFLWNHTHIWSDNRTGLSIVEGFDGAALQATFASAGIYSAGDLWGLKGSSATVTTAGKFYETSFQFSATNVSAFWIEMLCDGEYGDVEMGKVTIYPKSGRYESNMAVSVEFGSVITVRIQYQAMGSEVFGRFGVEAGNNAQVLFDNYTFSELDKISIAKVFAESTFETGEMAPYQVETNYFKDEQILGKLTCNPQHVINGTYSVLAGFDASTLADKWGKLMSVGATFEGGNKYAVQFRFRVISPSEQFFYLEMGGSTGLFVRFNATTVIETSQGVTATVEQAGDHCILKAVFDAAIDYEGLLWGTNGGGLIVFDDVYVCIGDIFVDFPAIEKVAPAGEKVFSESFENQNAGSNLTLNKYISGVDVFGYKFAYNCINGKISLVMYSGNTWAEVMYSKEGILQADTLYTLSFRYKKIDGEDANINLIIRGSTEKYIAFSTDGKVRAFTTDGGGFWKDISVAEVKDCNGYYEATVSFVAPANARFILGMYGAAEVAIDDITLFRGSVATFDGDAVPVSAPDKNRLLVTIDNGESVSETIYTNASYQAVREALATAKSVYNNLNATQQQVDEALAALENAIDNLTERADKTALNSAIATAEALAESDYTTASYATLKQALDAAKAVAANIDAIQADADNAVAALTEAQTALVKRADKTALNSAIAQAEALAESDYTTASYAALKQALDSAKAVAASVDAVQADADNAVATLAEAVSALVTVDSIRIQQFQEAVATLATIQDYDQLYTGICQALEKYNAVENKEAAQTTYAQLQAEISRYNQWATSINTEIANNNKAVTGSIVAIVAMLSLLAAAVVVSKKYF